MTLRRTWAPCWPPHDYRAGAPAARPPRLPMTLPHSPPGQPGPRPFKLPESVLVVIHTAALDVLLMRRADGGEH